MSTVEYIVNYLWRALCNSVSDITSVFEVDTLLSIIKLEVGLLIPSGLLFAAKMPIAISPVELIIAILVQSAMLGGILYQQNEVSKVYKPYVSRFERMVNESRAGEGVDED